MKKAIEAVILMTIIIGLAATLMTFLSVKYFICGSMAGVDNMAYRTNALCRIDIPLLGPSVKTATDERDIFAIKINGDNSPGITENVISDETIDDTIGKLRLVFNLKPDHEFILLIRDRLYSSKQQRVINISYTLENLGIAGQLTSFCITDVRCNLKSTGRKEIILKEIMDYSGSGFDDICQTFPVIIKHQNAAIKSQQEAFFTGCEQATVEVTVEPPRDCYFEETDDCVNDEGDRCLNNNVASKTLTEANSNHYIYPIEYEISFSTTDQEVETTTTDDTGQTITTLVPQIDVTTSVKTADNILSESTLFGVKVGTLSGIKKNYCSTPISPIEIEQASCVNGICEKDFTCTLNTIEGSCGTIQAKVLPVDSECDEMNNEMDVTTPSGATMDFCGKFNVLLISESTVDIVSKVLTNLEVSKPGLVNSFAVTKKLPTPVSIETDLQGVDVVVVDSSICEKPLDSVMWEKLFEKVTLGKVGIVLTHNVIDGSCAFGPMDINGRTVTEIVGIRKQSNEIVCISNIEIPGEIIDTQIFGSMLGLHDNIWGNALFGSQEETFPVNSYTSGGVVTTTKTIYTGSIADPNAAPFDTLVCASKPTYYLTAINYGRGRIIVNQFGFDTTDTYIANHLEEARLFLTSVLWASNKVALEEETSE